MDHLVPVENGGKRGADKAAVNANHRKGVAAALALALALLADQVNTTSQKPQRDDRKSMDETGVLSDKKGRQRYNQHQSDKQTANAAVRYPCAPSGPAHRRAGPDWRRWHERR
jgi:hypothetical protein